MTEIDVVRTYLEMTSPSQLKPAPLDRRARVEHAVGCTVSFFRYLYREVGSQYHWRDRLVWTDEQCQVRLDAPGVALWVLYTEGTPAGYFELERCADRSVEIVYFGLIPEFIGRGLGKQMLSAAVERAWAMQATRVWLHTCTQDSPAALPNYLRRGFTAFKTETFTAPAHVPVPVSSAPPPA